MTSVPIHFYGLVTLCQFWALMPCAFAQETTTQEAGVQERTLTQLIPGPSIAFVELAPASEWLNHPLRQQIQMSPTFKEVWRSDPVMKLRSGMMVAEFALGDSLENLIRKLTAGGVVLTVDKNTQGLAVLAKTESKDWLEVYLKKWVKLARDDAAQKNNDDPIKERDYRGLQAFKFNDSIFVALDEFLLISNKDTLAKEIADRFLDRATEGFEQTERYQNFVETKKRHAGSDEKDIGWLSVDVASLREAGVAKDLLAGKAKDFGAELILGGLLAVLHQTPTVNGSLSLSDSKIAMVLDSPFDPTWADDARVFFFGEQGKGQSLPLLKTANTIASLSAYRDVSQLWLRAGDLFDVAVNDQLAQADNTLTTLFSGRDFGEDILGAIYPEVRMVVASQDFSKDEAKPALKLPQFALVAKLRNPDLMKRELKRIFQSLVGFINITSAMEGQPQLDLDIESDGDQQYYTSRFVREIDRKIDAEFPVQFNFSPSLTFVDDLVILSSTVPLSKQLVEQLKSSAVDSDSSKSSLPLKNTLFEISADTLRESLEINRNQLISQNMIENGHTKSEAENEVGMLFSLLKLLDRGTMVLGFDDKATLETTVFFAK